MCERLELLNTQLSQSTQQTILSIVRSVRTEVKDVVWRIRGLSGQQTLEQFIVRQLTTEIDEPSLIDRYHLGAIKGYTTFNDQEHCLIQSRSGSEYMKMKWISEPSF